MTDTQAASPFQRFREPAAVVLAAVFVVLATQFLPGRLSGRPYAPDFLNGYWPGALSLRDGLGYRTAAGAFISHWPPGFSLFIAPWVSEDLVATARTLTHVNSALGVIWVLIVASLSKRLASTVSLWLTLPLALATPLLVLSSPQISEMLFAVSTIGALMLLTNGFAVLAKPGSPWKGSALIVSAGVVFGYAALVKTIGVVILAAITVTTPFAYRALSWRLRALGVAAMLGGAAVAMTPWVLTFAGEIGRPGLTTAGTGSMADGLTPITDSRAASLILESKAEWRGGTDYLRAIGSVFLVEPAGTARLYLGKAASVWYATASGRFDRYLLLIQGPLMLLFVASALLAAVRWRSVAPEVVLGFAVVFAVWAIAIVAHSIFRYLAPVFPLVPLLVFAAVQGLRRPVRSTRATALESTSSSAES